MAWCWNVRSKVTSHVDMLCACSPDYLRTLGEETFEVDLVDEERYASLAVSRTNTEGKGGNINYEVPNYLIMFIKDHQQACIQCFVLFIASHFCLVDYWHLFFKVWLQ